MVQRDTSATLSLDRYAKRAKVLVAGAQSVADERRHAEVQPLHLLACALSRDPGVVEVFRRAGTNVVELQSAVERSLNTLPKATESAYLSLAMLDLLERAEREAERERSGEVLVEHLLNALSQEIRGPAGELLGSFRVSPGSLRAHTGALKQVPSTAWAADTSSPERFTRDLVAEARSEGFDPVIGRVSEMRRLMTILERREKNHPLLVGEPGVGKSAVVRGLASRLSRNEVPANLKNTRLHELETGALMAGARLRGEMEERVRSLVANLSSGNGDSVLVVKNLDQLFGAGPAGSVLGDLLRPSLHRGELRLLGTVTPDGLKRLEERDPQFVRTLTVLPVEEPSLTEALDIVRGLAGRYEAHHQVNISESAVSAAVRLAKRYLQHRFLPDSAIDLLDEAAATQRIETDGTPAELDQALSRAQAIRAQLESLGGAQDQPSLEMCQKLNAEFRDLEPRIDQLRGGLESRKGAGGGRPLGEP
ncbi:MAG TPA: Clp protease N-terminal domain-containing protein, partial [Polyangiaceae bacterium]